MPAWITFGLLKWVVLGAVGLGVAAWAVTAITSPYKAQIVLLKLDRERLEADKVALIRASEDKERISDADRHRADLAETELAKKDRELEGVIRDANSQPTACRLSPAELERLRGLSAGSATGDGNKNLAPVPADAKRRLR